MTALTPISWTEFLPASLPGSSRIHLVQVNPFIGGFHALCGATKRQVSIVEAAKTLLIPNVDLYAQRIENVIRRGVNCTKCQDRRVSVHRSEFEYRTDEDRAYMTEDALRTYNARSGRINDLMGQVKAYRDAVWARAIKLAKGDHPEGMATTTARDVYPSAATMPFPRIKTEEELAAEREEEREGWNSAAEAVAHEPEAEEFTNQADFAAPTTDRGHAMTFAGNRRFEVGRTRVAHRDDLREDARSNGDPANVTWGTVAGFSYRPDGTEIIVRWDGDDRPDSELATEGNWSAYHHTELAIWENLPAERRARFMFLPDTDYAPWIAAGYTTTVAEAAETARAAIVEEARRPEFPRVRNGRFVVNGPAQASPVRSLLEALDAGRRAAEAQGWTEVGTVGEETVFARQVAPAADAPLLDRIDSELAEVKERAKTLEAWSVDANSAPFIPGVTRVLMKDEDTSTNREISAIPEPGTVVQSGRGQVHVVWSGDPTGASYTYAAEDLRIITAEQDPGNQPVMTPEEVRRSNRSFLAQQAARQQAQDNRAGLEGLGVPIHRNDRAEVDRLQAEGDQLRSSVAYLKRAVAEKDQALRALQVSLDKYQTRAQRAETTLGIIRRELNSRVTD